MILPMDITYSGQVTIGDADASGTRTVYLGSQAIGTITRNADFTYSAYRGQLLGSFARIAQASNAIAKAAR